MWKFKKKKEFSFNIFFEEKKSKSNQFWIESIFLWLLLFLFVLLLSIIVWTDSNNNNNKRIAFNKKIVDQESFRHNQIKGNQLINWIWKNLTIKTKLEPIVKMYYYYHFPGDSQFSKFIYYYRYCCCCFDFFSHVDHNNNNNNDNNDKHPLTNYCLATTTTTKLTILFPFNSFHFKEKSRENPNRLFLQWYFGFIHQW